MPSSLSVSGARELTSVVTRLRRALRRSIRSERPWGSRPIAQTEVLQTLRDTGPVRVGDLAERLRLAQSTVSALVSALSADGLVARAADPADGRATRVGLSADGRAHLRSWDAAHRRRIAAALAALAPTDRSAVLAALPALSRLVDALEEQ